MAVKKPELKQIAIDKLSRGKYQPRREFDLVSLQELAESIESAGLIQPIVVRPNNNDYEIVAGERRWRAAQLIGLESVPCLINYYSDEQAAAVTTIENINRVDLNPIEEAKAYQRIIDDFGYIHEEIAAVVGKSRAKITNCLRLLKLDPKVQTYLIEKKISEGHGKILVSLPRPLQLALANKAIARGWNVRNMELAAKQAQADSTQAIHRSDPNVKALESALTQHVGCKVKIDYDEDKGQVKIDFHN
ncbi:unnamed protein product [marine sediment metagenome]|uniref:ParB-like N-terminal domain-containing protein n=1 Tax=marine sediment metagenome TaxID=412755 RepID=X0ZY45_9ZZZZ